MKTLATCLFVLTVVACGKDTERELDKARKENAYTTQSCPARLPSAKESRIANPQEPTDCFAVVMKCNYCEYDSAGIFVKTESEVCGVCLGWDF